MKIICPICLWQGECSGVRSQIHCTNCMTKFVLDGGRRTFYTYKLNDFILTRKIGSSPDIPVLRAIPDLSPRERWFLDSVLRGNKWYVEETLQGKIGIVPMMFGCDFLLYFYLSGGEKRRTFLLFIEFKMEKTFEFTKRELYRLSLYPDTNFSASRFCGINLSDEGRIVSIFYIAPKWFEYFVDHAEEFFTPHKRREGDITKPVHFLNYLPAYEYLSANAPESYLSSERGEYLRRRDVVNWFIEKIERTPSSSEFRGRKS